MGKLLISANYCQFLPCCALSQANPNWPDYTLTCPVSGCQQKCEGVYWSRDPNTNDQFACCRGCISRIQRITGLKRWDYYHTKKDVWKSDPEENWNYALQCTHQFVVNHRAQTYRKLNPSGKKPKARPQTKQKRKRGPAKPKRGPVKPKSKPPVSTSKSNPSKKRPKVAGPSFAARIKTLEETCTCLSETLKAALARVDVLESTIDTMEQQLFR